MRRTWAAYFLAILVLFPAITQLDRPVSASSHSVYFALGDSIAAGVGSSLPRSRGYPAILGEWISRLDREATTVENLAVPGETAATFINDGQLNQFQQGFAEVKRRGATVRLITISLGGNEILNLANRPAQDREDGLTSFQGEIQDAVAAVRDIAGPDVPIALTTYYDLTEGSAELEFSDSWWIDQFNDAIRNAADQSDSLIVELAPPFEGRVDDLTRYPFDVHPTNQGYMAIAQAVWQGLEFDRTAPDIEMDGSGEFSRPTPTFRVMVNEDVAISAVTIDLSDGDSSPLIAQGDGLYLALLDLTGVTGTDEITVTITALDVAGNSATARSSHTFVH